MTTAKSILLEQFAVCFDKNGWFVALAIGLEGVDAASAAWKPAGVDNSIAEIVSHLNFYNFAYVERFKGVDYQYPTEDNDATFADAAGLTEERWKARIDESSRILNEFRELIAAADDSKFETRVSTENPVTWATLISNINAHNAHHAGQIVLLRKLQGNWQRDKGVS